MKKIALLLFFFSMSSFGCPELEGRWKSSKDKTMEFTQKWVNLEPKRLEFYSQIFGVQQIEYLEGKFIIDEIPRYKITIEGEEYDWGGEKEIVDYELLGCTSNQISIKFNLYNMEWIEVLNFINENMYWIYTGSQNMENGHTREYFERINPPNK